MATFFDSTGQVDIAATINDAIGPQSDGTYGYPAAALQVNNPANTAGYASTAPQSDLSLLKWGAGVLQGQIQFGNFMDYKRFEATNGGTFQQGQVASVPRVASGSIAPSYLWAAVLVIGGLLLITHKA